MGVCCCSLAGTRACFTCANSMSGVWDRYPSPYFKDWTHDLLGPGSKGYDVPPDWEELTKRAAESFKKLRDTMNTASILTEKSTLKFGKNYLHTDSSDEDVALAAQVSGV